MRLKALLDRISRARTDRLRHGAWRTDETLWSGVIWYRPWFLGLIPLRGRYRFCPHPHPNSFEAAECSLLMVGRAARIKKPPHE
jgi:hypothetical protein